MARVFEVGDELWELAEPLIPPVKVPAHQGQRPVPGSSRVQRDHVRARDGDSVAASAT
jgi:hypothetical protein